MGSKLRNSSRRRKAGMSTSKRSKLLADWPRNHPPTDFDALLARFSEALSLLATATRALTSSQEESQANPDHDIGEDITTLEHGLRSLRAVYNEFDVGLREIRK